MSKGPFIESNTLASLSCITQHLLTASKQQTAGQEASTVIQPTQTAAKLLRCCFQEVDCLLQQRTHRAPLLQTCSSAPPLHHAQHCASNISAAKNTAAAAAAQPHTLPAEQQRAPSTLLECKERRTSWHTCYCSSHHDHPASTSHHTHTHLFHPHNNQCCFHLQTSSAAAPKH
jgi:hypothetical protein